jgi:hypothetical protein
LEGSGLLSILGRAIVSLHKGEGRTGKGKERKGKERKGKGKAKIKKGDGD